MFRRTKICTGLMLAFGGSLAIAVLPAMAQAQADQQPQRVEITGSAIKRIDAETAVPVTVLKADDLKQAGVTSIEQVLGTIAASQSSTGTSQSVGSSTAGASFANMRGIGADKTLVLLNGRRIANNALSGSAPDLNMIPFAALDRVEVLRDGASALYGTDAVGGVINFITKKDFTGGTISLEGQSPQHPGGKSYGVNVGYGFGDIDQNGFNLLAVFDYQKQKSIAATQRAFGSTGFVPSRGISKSSGNSYPANYGYTSTDQATDPDTGAPLFDKNGNPVPVFASANPDAANGCTANGYTFAKTPGASTCRYDYTKWVDLSPEIERESALLKGTFKINENNQASLEYFVSHDKSPTTIAPVPYAGEIIDPGTKYYPGNGITPAPTGHPIDSTQPVYAYWRSIPGGPRLDEGDNTQQRLLASFDGSVAGWDYSAGAAYNQNRVTRKVIGGYLNDNLINTGIENGTINPFDVPDAAGMQAIQAAEVTGTLENAKGETWDLDGHGSREIGDWFGTGHQSALAVGTEFRREKYTDKANVPVASILESSTGFDSNTNVGGSRNIYAFYSELNMPVLKDLELTAALRYDHYSDFGSTTNPKVSFRYQPAEQLLIRGSYTTGFRAPSLYELDSPVTFTNTGNSYDDPVLCPGGTAVAGQNQASVCDTQFMTELGGNKALKPEKSKSWTLGFVVEPMRGTSVGLDFWWIRLQHMISALDQDTIFADPAKYADLFHRNASGRLSVSGQDCKQTNGAIDPTTCGYITDTNANLGGTNTYGVDLNLASRMKTAAGTFNFDLNGTYINHYEFQTEENGAWTQNAGVYAGGSPVFRWQHTASVAWTRDSWTIGAMNHYKSGYFDQNDPTQVSSDAFAHNRVAPYITTDLYGTWSPMKALSLTVGVRNVFDQDPPFSNQGATFQVGYDPRYTDPTGRAYYARATYNF